MGKKILILCDAFGPPAYLPRIINLCNNLSAQKWEPYIFTEKMLDVNFSSDVCPIFQMPYFKNKNRLYWTIKWSLQFFFQKKDKELIHFIESAIHINDFDLILCSSFNLFPQTAASKIANKYNKPLIIDLRDITEQWNNTNYFAHTFGPKSLTKKIHAKVERVNINRRNKALQIAKVITTISPWHQSFLKHINSNTHLIYNGYDATTFYPKKITSNTFDINYTGRIYDLQFRNPNLLFEAIQQLDSDKIISSRKLKINWYIDEKSKNELIELIKKYDIEDYNQIYDFVPSNQIPKIMNNASINIILTSKASKNGPHGIMTTKFFEALGVEKPILCVKSDEACLAQTIKETGAGLAATTVEEVKGFILKYYDQWEKIGYTHVDVINKKQFSRQHQALQFEEIFEQLILLKS